MLSEFWQSQKGFTDISVSFLVMGQLPDGSLRIEVVQESNLSSAKKKFSKINSEHIYSLQKTVSDLQTLALVKQFDPRFSTIKCRESSLKQSQTLFIPQVPVEKEIVKIVEKGDKLTEPTKVEEKKKKTIDKEARLEKNSKKPLESAKGFENIFGKRTKEGNVKEKFLEKEKLNNDKELEKKAGNLSSAKENKKRKMENYKKGNEAKKRKRIFSSSDLEAESVSSEDKEDKEEKEEKEEFLTSESEEKFEKAKIEEKLRKSESPPKKEKEDRSADRTFLDEDGFLVTQKVVVREVEKRNLVEPPPEKRREINVKKKQTKQATLTSFFKKA